MKQIIQDLKSGATILEEVPAPQVKAGYVLIKTTRTLVSLGTERMLVEFGRANLVDKARQQPDKVKQVLDKIKTDGMIPTLEAVFNKLNQPLPLGYCNVGKVIAVGKGVSEFSVGDRVASNGNHAEFVCVPKNLVAKIPDNVSDDEAAFTVMGSIALEGVRLLSVQLGEVIVVVGLGLVGLLAIQLLKANGCKVIGVDFDQQKVDLASKLGITAVNPSAGTDAVSFVEEFTSGIGADGVLITASSKSDSVQVSCSYGPGRYDEDYENRGIDYPLPYVRWTEKRNFETILGLLSDGSVDVKSLITDSYDLEDYDKIYGDMRKQGSIASILRYSDEAEHKESVSLATNIFKESTGKIGIIGAGNYTSSTVIPALLKAGAHVKYISSRTNGLEAKNAAKKMKAETATTNYKAILSDPEVSMVICTTRHDAHAQMVCETLESGKSVFVEKPLCLNRDELERIIETYVNAPEGVTLTVGFNRRFSPFAQKMKKLLGDGPKNIVATMNAGYIPPEMWVHDMETGGGRIIGEACHFIDLCSYLTDSRVKAVCVNALGNNPKENTDNDKTDSQH